MADVVHFVGNDLEEIGFRVFGEDLKVILLLKINLLDVDAVLEEFVEDECFKCFLDVHKEPRA